MGFCEYLDRRKQVLYSCVLRPRSYCEARDSKELIGNGKELLDSCRVVSEVKKQVGMVRMVDHRKMSGIWIAMRRQLQISNFCDGARSNWGTEGDRFGRRCGQHALNFFVQAYLGLRIDVHDNLRSPQGKWLWQDARCLAPRDLGVEPELKGLTNDSAS